MPRRLRPPALRVRHPQSQGHRFVSNRGVRSTRFHLSPLRINSWIGAGTHAFRSSIGNATSSFHYDQFDSTVKLSADRVIGAVRLVLGATGLFAPRPFVLNMVILKPSFWASQVFTPIARSRESCML